MILVLLILLTIYFVYKFKKELFQISEYNSYIIPEQNYEVETKNLQVLFKKTNKMDFPSQINDFVHVKNISTKLHNLLNDSVINYLDSIKKDSPFEKTTFIQFSDSYNIHKRGNDLYTFSIDIKNQISNSITTISVIARIEDDLVNIISLKVTIRSRSITYKGIEDPIFNDNPENYYRIRNTLHLTEPYLTSGKDMQITEADKLEFQEILKIKNEKLTNFNLDDQETK